MWCVGPRDVLKLRTIEAMLATELLLLSGQRRQVVSLLTVEDLAHRATHHGDVYLVALQVSARATCCESVRNHYKKKRTSCYPCCCCCCCGCRAGFTRQLGLFTWACTPSCTPCCVRLRWFAAFSLSLSLSLSLCVGLRHVASCVDGGHVQQQQQQQHQLRQCSSSSSSSSSGGGLRARHQKTRPS